jgi:hypothetical protein
MHLIAHEDVLVFVKGHTSAGSGKPKHPPIDGEPSSAPTATRQEPTR